MVSAIRDPLLFCTKSIYDGDITVSDTGESQDGTTEITLISMIRHGAKRPLDRSG